MRSILTIVLLLAGALPAQTNNWLAIGGGCRGACGGYPVLDCQGFPAAVGQPIAMAVYPVPFGMPVFLYGGATIQALDLFPLLGEHCDLVIDGAAGVVSTGIAASPAFGLYTAFVGLDVPNNAALVGLAVAFQAMTFDPCTPSGVVVTAGAAAVLR